MRMAQQARDDFWRWLHDDSAATSASALIDEGLISKIHARIFRPESQSSDGGGASSGSVKQWQLGHRGGEGLREQDETNDDDDDDGIDEQDDEAEEFADDDDEDDDADPGELFSEDDADNDDGSRSSPRRRRPPRRRRHKHRSRGETARDTFAEHERLVSLENEVFVPNRHLLASFLKHIARVRLTILLFIIVGSGYVALLRIVGAKYKPRGNDHGVEARLSPPRAHERAKRR